MTKAVLLLALGALTHANLVAAASQQTPKLPLCASAPDKVLTAPRIQSLERSPRRDGVWHLVTISFAGEKQGSYQLELQWEAQTPREDGQGTTNSKSLAVITDEKGSGEWKVEVRGYPAGKLRARVMDKAGAISEWSLGFDVPWLY